MFHRLDRPNPYLEKQVASEILFKQSMLDLDDIINHQPVSVSQNNMEDLGNGWRCQKLHNEIYIVGLSFTTFFYHSFFIMY